MSDAEAGGALAGLRVIELEAKGPAPFGAMLLADLGAEVIRVERVPRPGAAAAADPGGLTRGRRSLALNLKDREGLELLLELAAGADVLIEAYRPGVAERLGFGPEVCRERNPRLIYARMTGWGQEGPFAARAAHDINFLAIAGALYPLGAAASPPPPPLNLVGDFGGGAAYLVIGVLAALLERQRSGTGQVIDAAMIDGVLSLMTAFHALGAAGLWSERREDNIVDGGAPWYRTYETADGGFVAVGALEPAFFGLLLEALELDPEEWPMYERERWPEQRRGLAEIFASRPRSHWEQLFADSDACVTPVLTPAESILCEQVRAREGFVASAGAEVPQAAPRLQRTPPRVGAAAGPAGRDCDAVLAELGIGSSRIGELRESGVVG